MAPLQGITESSHWTITGAAGRPFPEALERELVAACQRAYVLDRGVGDAPYDDLDLEHDVERVLSGALPERCDNWRPRAARYDALAEAVRPRDADDPWLVLDALEHEVATLVDLERSREGAIGTHGGFGSQLGPLAAIAWAWGVAAGVFVAVWLAVALVHV